MKITFTEPVAPRYMYIHQATNTVHLMVPVVGGLDISTDNTCKVTEELTSFFKLGAMRELKAYQAALQFDIALLKEETLIRKNKEARLTQIKAYIGAMDALGVRYFNLIKDFLKKSTNLYSIQLCPAVLDNISEVINPVFSIFRGKTSKDISKSILCHWMDKEFSKVTISVLEPKTQLTHEAIAALSKFFSFEDIQKTLTVKALDLFGISIDFTKTANGDVITKEYIDDLMGFEGAGTLKEYIDALLGSCALDLLVSLRISPFYSITDAHFKNHRAEQLSIITQFFLAHLNVYCKARNISHANFGKLFDASSDLSKKLVDTIVAALSNGSDVEKAIYSFFNAHLQEFELVRALNAEDLVKIKQSFETNYHTVTATKENPHMDDFMILDTEASGDALKFFKHQGAICLNFAEIIPADLGNQAYFEKVRIDFIDHTITVPHQNNWVCDSVDTEDIILPSSFDSHQFVNLPQKLQEHFINLQGFYEHHLSQFLDCVAKGKQVEAEGKLKMVPQYTQALLSTSGVLKDYSGRQFNCTAFEYAYWAKDVYMCRMLLGFMQQDTKDIIVALIDEIENKGLCFNQKGNIQRTSAYDFFKLIAALDFVCKKTKRSNKKAKSKVEDSGLATLIAAQMDMPAHVVHEYCSNEEKKFYPIPLFKNENLIRSTVFYHSPTSQYQEWFSLDRSSIDFALLRGDQSYPTSVQTISYDDDFWMDLDAMKSLDETRIADLKLLKDDLHLKENVRLSNSY